MTTMNAETTDSGAGVAPQGASVAPEGATPTKTGARKKGAPKTPKAAVGSKAAKPKKGKKAATRPEPAPHTNSKSEKILQMIGRAKGATLADIMDATGWQAHSVRGFISTAGKKHKVKIESTKNLAGGRVYRIED